VTSYANSTVIGTEEVTLASGAMEVRVFEWNTEALQRGNYTLSAQASPVINETFIEDNSINYASDVCISFPGDVDGDGDVDIFDITSMAAIYGVVKPNPAYSPNRDIDDDGDVDIFDVVTAAYNYGQPSSPSSQSSISENRALRSFYAFAQFLLSFFRANILD